MFTNLTEAFSTVTDNLTDDIDDNLIDNRLVNDNETWTHFYPNHMINAQGEFNEIIDINPETGSLMSKKSKISEHRNNEHGTLIKNLDSKNNFPDSPADYDPTETRLSRDIPSDIDQKFNDMYRNKIYLSDDTHDTRSLNTIEKDINVDAQKNIVHNSKVGKRNKLVDKISNTDLKINQMVTEQFTNLMKTYDENKSFFIKALQNNVLIILIGILFMLLLNVIIKITRKL